MYQQGFYRVTRHVVSNYENLNRDIENRITAIPSFLSIERSQASKRRRELNAKLTYEIEGIKDYFDQDAEVPESSQFAQKVIELLELTRNVITRNDLLVWLSHSRGVLDIEDEKSGTIFTIEVEQQEPLLIYETFFVGLDDAILIIRNLLTEIVNAMDHR